MAERGVRLYATVAIDKVIGEVPTEVESVAKATEALKNSNAIVIADVPDSENSPEIALPKRVIRKMRLSAFLLIKSVFPVKLP